jgi:hypothetical protein
MLLRNRGDLEGARGLLVRAIDLQQAALRGNPGHPVSRTFLRNHYHGLAETLLRLGEHAGAAEAAAEMCRVFPDRPFDQYNAACFLARCVALAASDPGLGMEKREELARTYASQAVQFLLVTIHQGYKNTEQLRQDPVLDPIWSRDASKQLLNAPKQGGKPQPNPSRPLPSSEAR